MAEGILHFKKELLRLKRLKDEYAELNRRRDDVRRELDMQQAAVYAYMEEYDIESMKVDDLTFIRTAPREFATVQDREAFVEWAMRNDASLVAMKEEKRLLNQLVRERIDNGEELPPGIGFYTREIVSIRTS